MTDIHKAVGEALIQESGLADFQLAERLKMPVKSVKAALRDLINAGAVYDNGDQRIGPGGARSKVLFAVKSFDFAKPLVIVKEPKKAKPRESRQLRETKRSVTNELLDCAHEIAKKMPIFTADDVRLAFDARGTFGPCDPRMTGPIMIKAAKRGWCELTDRVIRSERRSAGLTAVYRSKLCSEEPVPAEEDVGFLKARVAALEAENQALRSQLEARRAV